MAPRFPKEGSQANLQELTPHLVTIKSFEVQPESKYGTSLKVVYELVDDPEQTVWDFLNYLDTTGNAKLGKSPAGGVSRFRGWCNALGGRPEGAKVAFFDDESMQIVWAEGGELTLEPGLTLRIVGELRERNDGEGSMFRVTKYRASDPTPRRVPVTAPPVQAVSEQTSIDPDDVPY
jgi:hypothetical protein